MKNRQILTLVAENEAGVLARITDAFSSRGCSIENINAGTINYENNTSSITIVLYETLEKINKIIPQIKKIVPIIEVKNITDRNVAKELVLVSYTKESKKMRQIILNYSAKKICVEDGINVIELVAISEIIDNFVKDLNSAGYYNIVRSGILAIEIK